MFNFGQLKQLKLREVWPDEAENFTPWLAEHIHDLGEMLGMSLQLSPDSDTTSSGLRVKDTASGRNVLIESQLETTDDLNLGKMMASVAKFDAVTVVWIAETFRAEHQKTLTWLNRNLSDRTSFFGLTLEVWQIDNSNPAINFKPIVLPENWSAAGPAAPSPSKPITKSSEERTEADAYRDFFQQLIDELREKHMFTGATVAQPRNWYAFASGFSDVFYGARFLPDDHVRVELHIDRSGPDKSQHLFDVLARDKAAIEKAFGESLVWERQDGKRDCRIAVYRDGAIANEAAELDEIRDWMIEHLVKLNRVFFQRLQKNGR